MDYNKKYIYYLFSSITNESTCVFFYSTSISVLLTLQPPEAVTWLAVEHEQKKALEIFSREIAPAGTGMGQFLCAIVGIF